MQRLTVRKSDCVFVQVGGFAALWLRVFLTKGSLQGHPECVNMCECVCVLPRKYGHRLHK